jgi:hypothetical protein
MSGLTPDDQDAVLGNLLDEFDQATAKLDAVERCPWSPVTLQAAAKGSHVLPSCRVFRRVSLGLQADHVASQRIFLDPSTPPAPTYHGFADLVPTVAISQRVRDQQSETGIDGRDLWKSAKQYTRFVIAPSARPTKSESSAFLASPCLTVFPRAMTRPL